jgi:hypothetical protein
MPSDLWTIEQRVRGVNLHEHEVSLGDPRVGFQAVRPIVEADWSRVDFYAHRIRQLGSFMLPGNRVIRLVHQDLVHALSQRSSMKTLLPNLRSIYFTISEDFISSAHFLLGPSVRHVQIASMRSDHPSLNSLCSSVLRLSPNIQHLCFMPYGPPVAQSSLFDLVCGLHDLHTLYICRAYCTEQVLIHLGHLPSLKKLISINISSGMLRLLTTDNGRFPSLTDLYINDVCQWSACQTIMDSMRCQFIDLSIRIYPSTAPQSLSTLACFTQSFLQHPCVLSLLSISLSDTTVPLQVDDSDVETSVFNIFRPLFACTQLKSILLDFGITNYLGDSWLSDASCAWPLLQSLKLAAIQRTFPRMTLSGLVALVKHCPDLIELNLPLDVKPVDSASLDGICNHRFKSLRFGNSSIITPPDEVVRSLTRMFPNLSSVTVAADDQDGLAEDLEWKIGPN